MVYFFVELFLSRNENWRCFYEHNLNETLRKTLLRKLDFSRIQLDKPLEKYSDGQKKKLLVAKSLCEQVHLYI